MEKKQILLPEDAVEVAYIAGAWGIKGGLKVVPFNKDADALLNAKQWFICAKQMHWNKDREDALQKVQNVSEKLIHIFQKPEIREHSSGLVVSAHEVHDRNVAESLKGARVFVSRADFPKLSSDEFYWIDLIGLQVVNQRGVVFGNVIDLMNNGPQALLRVPYEHKDQLGKEHQIELLIPFVEAFIVNVDLNAGVIQVDWETEYSL